MYSWYELHFRKVLSEIHTDSYTKQKLVKLKHRADEVIVNFHTKLISQLRLCFIFLEILRLLMPGIKTHIGSSDPKVRKLGMFVGEVVTTAIDPEGPKLNFEVSKC